MATSQCSSGLRVDSGIAAASGDVARTATFTSSSASSLLLPSECRAVESQVVHRRQEPATPSSYTGWARSLNPSHTVRIRRSQEVRPAIQSRGHRARCVRATGRASRRALAGSWVSVVRKQVHSGDENLFARGCRGIDEPTSGRRDRGSVLADWVGRHNGRVHVVDDRVVRRTVTGSYPAALCRRWVTSSEPLPLLVAVDVLGGIDLLRERRLRRASLGRHVDVGGPVGAVDQELLGLRRQATPDLCSASSIWWCSVQLLCWRRPRSCSCWCPAQPSTMFGVFWDVQARSSAPRCSLEYRWRSSKSRPPNPMSPQTCRSSRPWPCLSTPGRPPGRRR